MSTTTTPSTQGRAAVSGPSGPDSRPAAAPRVVRQRRRRPGLIALSVALIAAGALSGALLFTASGQRTAVLVVARDVPVGAAITDADLAPASLALDPAVKAVPVAKKKTMVGQRAAVALKAGALLSPGQVTSVSLVKAGEQLVGVALKPSQLPASRLAPGQKVVIVSTPDAAGQVAGVSQPSRLVRRRRWLQRWSRWVWLRLRRVSWWWMWRCRPRTGQRWPRGSPRARSR